MESALSALKEVLENVLVNVGRWSYIFVASIVDGFPRSIHQHERLKLSEQASSRFSCTMAAFAVRSNNASWSVPNGIMKCYKGHSHLSTPWTIYVVDPASSHDVETYGEALSPIDVFDTKEQVDQLYKQPAFSKPYGPPSWSMGVPGGAIAVFQGGKFGFPVVKPEWEDPATRNGGEYRFVFDPNMDSFTVLDNAFQALVAWMTTHPVYEGVRLLGLFVKNTSRPNTRDSPVQFRMWTSEMIKTDVHRLARTIGNDMSKVLAQTGARGILTYKGLDDLIRRAKATSPQEIEQDNRNMNAIRLKFYVPVRVPGMNGHGDKAD